MDTKLRMAMLGHLKAWATKLGEEIRTGGVFLFGSLVYKEGVQFIPATSDVDLVAFFPPDIAKDAVARVQWLEEVRVRKAALEEDFGRMLLRKFPDAPIVSLVPVTTREVTANIHKDGAVGFFSKNQFVDVRDGKVHNGLPHAGEQPLNDALLVQCLRFAQKKRNELVGVTASGAKGLAPFSDLGGDPAPKDVMRHAAMAAALKQGIEEPGAEYDTQKGLDLLSAKLYDLRASKREYADLQEALSVRRGARGEPRPLSSSEQMLLAEMISGLAGEAYDSQQPKLPSIKGRHSTEEFADRFAQAFPGVRGIAWFDDPADVKRRLERLLRGPLVYSDATPVWWFGDGNLPIENFAEIEPGIFLVNVEEQKIRRIAAVAGRASYRSFVYVECDPMPPVGLYKYSENRAAQAFTNGQFYSEEYGLLKDGRRITRTEFDDGATIIDGVPVDVRGQCDLRVRYLTPYNFVIAPAQSPINNNNFDDRLEDHLHAILAGSREIDELAADVARLPKRPFDI